MNFRISEYARKFLTEPEVVICFPNVDYFLNNQIYFGLIFSEQGKKLLSFFMMIHRRSLLGNRITTLTDIIYAAIIVSQYCVGIGISSSYYVKKNRPSRSCHLQSIDRKM